MKKIFLSVVLILTLTLFGCSKKNSNINIKFYSQYYPLTNINTDSLNNNDVTKLLTTSYYENEYTALFNSSTLNNNISIYHLGWTAEILKLNDGKYNQLYCETLSNNIPNIDINKLNLDDLLHYSYGVNLCNIDQKEKISNKLFTFYNSDEKLFFYTDKNDQDFYKIRATYLALNIINILNIQNNYNDDIYNSLMNYYKEITFNSETASFLNDGGYLILSLKSVRNHPMNFDTNVTDWLKNVTSKYFDNNKQYKMVEIMNIYYLVILNKNFNNDITITLNEYLNEFFEKNKNIYDLVFQTDSFNSDPQYIYKLLFICQQINYQIKSDIFDKLNNYIQDNIYSNFSKSNLINLNFEDTFYGTILANKYNFVFDKTKIKNSLINYKSSLLLKTDLPETEIKNLYYLLLISKELKINLLNDDEKEILLNGVFNIIKNIDLNVIDINDIDNLNFSIESAALLDGYLDKNQISQINTKLNILLKDAEVNQSIFILDITLMQYYLKLSDKIPSAKINDLLNLLYKQGQYVPINADNTEEIEDIKYTYKVFVTSQYDKNLDINYKDLNNYLESLKDSKYVVKPNKNSNYTNLQTIYYYLILTSVN